MSRITPKTYTNPIFNYKRSADQDADHMVKHQVVIIGAGPTGLVAAMDLASRGIPSVIITKKNTVVVGSRAICFAKKTLEIVNRLQGVDRMIDKGVVWNLGKVFYDKDLIYQFNLLEEEGHKIPAFINLQQYYFEEYLIDQFKDDPLIDIRWEEEMIDIEQDEAQVLVTIKTPDGNYQIASEYVLACDGVHSNTRKILKLPYEGEQFEEHFLIADISMENDFPTERWFWFDPPFNRGYSALLHKQPDNLWRIDLQLGWDIDKEKELDPERIKVRLHEMLGPDVKFQLEWTSIYQFRSVRMPKFVHDRIIFAGDAAHLVSPFGARGANSGVQDVDNLIWKLAYILKEKAPRSLLTTYDEERGPATDENILHSSNATDFISPKSAISLQFRNAALDLAKHNAFARTIINSGRLSSPYRYVNSSLVKEDSKECWETNFQPGHTVKDAYFESGYLIDHLSNDFTLMIFGQLDVEHDLLTKILQIEQRHKDVIDKYDLQPGSWYLIRPDHHIAARGRYPDASAIASAIVHSLKGYYNKDQNNQAFTDKDALGKRDVFVKHLNDKKYKMLIDAHKDLNQSESQLLNSKLLLLMMDKVNEHEFKSIIKQLL